MYCNSGQGTDRALEGSHTDLSHQGLWQGYFVSHIYILLWLLQERHHLEWGCEMKPDGVDSHHSETARVWEAPCSHFLLSFVTNQVTFFFFFFSSASEFSCLVSTGFLASNCKNKVKFSTLRPTEGDI